MIIGGFFRCQGCGKLHTRHGINPSSVCKCGMELFGQAFQVPTDKNGIPRKPYQSVASEDDIRHTVATRH